MAKKILVIAAHPDDEILGCGGTVARLVKEGCEAFTLLLGEGITSRDEKRNIKKRAQQIQELRRAAEKANHLLGVQEVFLQDFPDNRFDTVPLLDIVKTVERIKAKVKPEIIFTHFPHDLNIDHQITFEAVITAARPLPTEPVKEVYTFEIPSSTEYGFSCAFLPDTFFDIKGTLDIKVAAIKMYRSELKPFPHPRSLEGIKLNARWWGMRAGRDYVEVFKTIRVVR